MLTVSQGSDWTVYYLASTNQSEALQINEYLNRL